MAGCGARFISGLTAVLLLGSASIAAPSPQAAPGEVCQSAATFVGEPVQTEDRHVSRFMMVSAYHLEPYTHAFLENVLGDLGRHHISGIAYGTLGAMDAFFRRKGVAVTEAKMNADLYGEAKSLGAKIWLQIRMYDNQLAVSGAAPRNVTAEEILSSPPAMKAYLQNLRDVVETYNNAFSDACVIVLFEEAGIYHAPQGGGTFWSSEAGPVGRRSDVLDQMFADRFVGLYQPAAALIKSINPKCSIGVHLGHSAMDNRPVLSAAFAEMAAKGGRPDFIFYDLYLKSQRTTSAYDRVLTERANFMLDDLHMPAVHLAQLQTMNHFQNGFAQTPSKQEIDDIVALDEKLGFKGIGFYTKNAVPTADFANDPLAPNKVGQATVYASSRDRWDYAILKLYELEGIDFRHQFDLVIQSAGSAPATVEIRNVATARWDILGTTVPSPDQKLSVFRELDARLYLEDDRHLALRIVPGADHATDAYTITVLASQPSSAFRTTASLQAELTQTKTIAGTRGGVSIEPGDDAKPTWICVH